MADVGNKQGYINEAAKEQPKLKDRGSPAGGGRIDGGSPSEAVRLLEGGRPAHQPLHGMHPRGSHGR